MLTNYSHPVVDRALIYDNQANSAGGAVYVLYHSFPEFTNCSIVNNTTPGWGGGFYCNDIYGEPIITNSIIWGNESDYDLQIFALGANPTVNYSDVQDGTGEDWFGEGCIDADPLFLDPGNDIFFLTASSPCIDAGAESVYISIWDTTIYAPTTDLDGNPRPLGDGWDIGAYEYDPDHPVMAYELFSGWNLLSVPFSDTFALADLFPFYIYPAWAWDNESKTYNIIYSVTSGEAFYLFSPLDTVIAINGTREATSITDTLYRGWNLIGAPSTAVNCSTITDLPDVISDIFGFDAATQNYNIADFIRPGCGYWLFTTDTLELEMP